MKKVIGLLTGCCLALGAQAADNKMWPGYRDYFHFSNSTPAAHYIGKSNSTVDFYQTVIGPRSFEIRDASGSLGYGQITVNDVTNPYFYCVLDITDGPWMMHPTISAACNGAMIYNGFTYDGSDSYTLYLDYLPGAVKNSAVK